MNSETKIQNSIREVLKQDGYIVFRHHQGLGAYKGFSDLTALKNGITLYIEIKTPKGKQSEYQKQFQHDIELHGGIYILARSVADVVPYLTTKPLF